MELVVALDLPQHDANLELARKIGRYPLWFKVGFRSYIRDGKALLKALKEINPDAKIFLDLKLYDIPNTMADAAEEIAALGVEMFNVHASAGKAAMQAVMQRLESFEKRPLVLAVTALTSFDDESFRAIYGAPIEQKASAFAVDAFESGLDGVVCSAFESAAIKEATNDRFITLTPGIRPFGEAAGDQTRVADIALAKAQQVDYIVVGRPAYKDPDPAAKVAAILEAIRA